MAEIRCPMCGRPNPDTLDECQFCGARLTPLIAGADNAAPEAEGEAAEESIEFLPDEEFPDWLEEEDEGEEAFDVRRTTQTGSLRDPLSWLDDMEANAPAAPPPAESQSAEETIQHVTGWLASLIGDDEETAAEPAAEEPAAATESPAQAASEEEEELPDWLKAEPAAEEPAAAAESPAQAAPEEEEELPDWLKEEPAAESPVQAAPEEEEELISADTSSLPDMDIPDWLRPSGEGEAESAPSLEETDSGWLDILRSDTTDESGEEAPDWLEAAEQEPLTAEEGAESNVSPFTLDESIEVELGALESEEVPDWLTGVTETAPETFAEAPEEKEEPEETLERANLPAWLQEMKPVEAVSSPQLLPEDENAPPVDAGPLAGLRGVLPSAIPGSLIAKPATPSAKLSISEEQEAHIGLLRALLEHEEKAESVPAPSPITSRRLLRWFIALLLLAAVVWPLLSGGDGNILPSVPPPEVQGAFQQVEALPAQAPVLVAFDYQPAFGGELDAAANALIEHLMLQGASLVTVSTQPEGLLLAEHAFKEPAARHAYHAGEQYLNLGYVPGGTTGLSALADHLFLTLRQTPSGYSLREQPLLQDIQGIQDFALLVVLTDDPEVARAWIEQVGARAPNLPIIMAVSAQAGPLVYPYYDAQIKGLVSGLTGGAAYERQTGLGGLAQNYGGAFSTGTLLAILLILFGSLAQYVWSAIRGENTHQDGGHK